MNKLLVTFRVSSVVKNMNLVKNFVQLGGKKVNCAKLKITLKVVFVCKESKNQKGSKKNNSTNFTENNDYKSDQSLFTVTQYVNQVDKPGQPITLNFMAPFYGWGSTASRLVRLRGGNLLFTTKFPDTPGTHFIDLGRMKG